MQFTDWVPVEVALLLIGLTQISFVKKLVLTVIDYPLSWYAGLAVTHAQLFSHPRIPPSAIFYPLKHTHAKLDNDNLEFFHERQSFALVSIFTRRCSDW
jgi:hypothetical protein